MGGGPREIKIVIIQSGPASEMVEENVLRNLSLIREQAHYKPDFVLLAELSTTPYFGGLRDKKYLKWAESIPGPSTEAVAKLATEMGSTIIFPLFEREGRNYFSSVAVVGPDGHLIPGRLPGGKNLPCYRKTHLAEVPAAGLYEGFYFRPGKGLPVFQTEQGVIGILVCWDRCFPEAWRTLALMGAEVIFVPACIPAWNPRREEQTILEYRVRALDNLLFVVEANKAGVESLGGKETPFFGHSCVVGPEGDLIAEGPSMKAAALTAHIDLNKVEEARRKYPFYLHRRPKIYRLVV